MKIALMTNNYKPFMGGVPISIERLKLGLEQLGHEVVIFAPTYANQQEEAGVFRYRNLMNRFIGGIVLPNAFDPQIEQVFQQERFDIIHIHHPFLIGNMAMYLSRKYHVPLAFTYHTRYEQYLDCYAGWIKPLKYLLPLYLKAFFKRVDFIFAPTQGMADYLTEECNVEPAKLSILPTGLPNHCYTADEADIQELRKNYHAENMPLLLSVSRMTKEKNVEFLIHAVSKLKTKYQKPFRVLLVGDGPDKEHYRKICKEQDLEDRIYFVGQVPNQQITPYFAAADAFIFASKTETQGIVIIEAFAAQTPVYALDASGVHDLVEDGINGRLCPEDEDLFAEQLLHFMEDDINHRQLAQNAYATALTFQEEAVAVHALELYNEIIASYKESKIHTSSFYSKIHNRVRRLWKLTTTTF